MDRSDRLNTLYVCVRVLLQVSLLSITREELNIDECLYAMLNQMPIFLLYITLILQVIMIVAVVFACI
jgi:hypothetical protein